MSRDTPRWSIGAASTEFIIISTPAIKPITAMAISKYSVAPCPRMKGNNADSYLNIPFVFLP